MKHYTIPVFIPELACPFQCVFCNQKKISGHRHIADTAEVKKTIELYLSGFKHKNRHVEVGFFGGNFTGIPLTEQEKYLKVVQPYLEKGLIHGIRLSTRPDYIDKNVLDLLSQNGVTTVELGAQSLDDDVLKASYRGHTAEQVKTASEMILERGFELGLQMMIGLPDDTLEKSLKTAQKIKEYGATNTRIYPTLIIKDTALHLWYKKGKYKPLTLDEAVLWSKRLLLYFEKENVNVIRLGLHPSEGLLSGEELVAGPFHPSFRELVLTEIWWDKLKQLMSDRDQNGNITVKVSPDQINYAIGYGAKNKKRLLQHFNSVKIVSSSDLKGRDFVVQTDV
jgi:histone acetyltransferase (RNA polymerase elongator complex component)